MPLFQTIQRAAGVLLLIIPVLAQSPVAPSTVSVVPAPGKLTATTKMEAESVEIGDLMAFPSSITRTPGPFILELLNRTHFRKPVLEWASPTPAATQVATIAAAANPKVLLQVRKQISIVNVPPGVYLLQTKDGQVFLTLTIR